MYKRKKKPSENLVSCLVTFTATPAACDPVAHGLHTGLAVTLSHSDLYLHEMNIQVPSIHGLPSTGAKVAACDTVTLSQACAYPSSSTVVFYLSFFIICLKRLCFCLSGTYHRSSSVCLTHQLHLTNSGKQINNPLARVNWLVSF